MQNNEPRLSVGAVVGVLLILATLFFFIFCFRTVGAGQVGIVTRFGEVNRVETSGVAVKLPWPIESITKMDIRVQKEEQTATAATSDLQDATAVLALNYALDNASALRVYKELGKNYKDTVITVALQESFKAASANFTAQQLVTERPKVKQAVLDIVKTRIEKYGIRVVDVSVVDFKFSAEFNAAIEATQVANQNVARMRQELESVKVQAEKDITAARGAAEAQRLQRETLTPELIELRKIESQNAAINKWNGVLPTTQAGESSLFNIPLR
jgi:regulator of protease activity HflC (stomatin/prohibitin superfamily)